MNRIKSYSRDTKDSVDIRETAQYKTAHTWDPVYNGVPVQWWTVLCFGVGCWCAGVLYTAAPCIGTKWLSR